MVRQRLPRRAEEPARIHRTAESLHGRSVETGSTIETWAGGYVLGLGSFRATIELEATAPGDGLTPQTAWRDALGWGRRENGAGRFRAAERIAGVIGTVETRR